MVGRNFEVELGSKFRGLRSRVQDTTPLMERIGALMVSSIEKSFLEESRGGKRWPERGQNSNIVKNVAGLIEDLNKGGVVKSRRFDSRPVLKDTGFLARSIAFRVLDDTTMEVGTVAVDYARKQQEGGDVKIEISDRAADGIASLIRKRPELEGELGKLLNADVYQTQIKPRTFVSFEKKDELETTAETIRFFAKNL